MPLYRCHFCNGSRKDPHIDKPCPECGGTGYTFYGLPGQRSTTLEKRIRELEEDKAMGYAGTCPRCGGHGSYVFSPDNRRFTTCARCKGTGVTYLEDLSYCPVCHGKGQVTVRETGATAICQTCRGWGTAPMGALGPRRRICENCNGTGDMSLTTDPEPCVACQGVGTVPMEEEPRGDYPCQNCAGLGRVRSPDTGTLDLVCPVCHGSGRTFYRDGLHLEKEPQVDFDLLLSMKPVGDPQPGHGRCPKCMGGGCAYCNRTGLVSINQALCMAFGETVPVADPGAPICQNCKGAGLLADKVNAPPCETCRGTGRAWAPERTKCVFCQGTGKDTEGADTAPYPPCPECQGTGSWAQEPQEEEQTECYVCEGSGQVWTWGWEDHSWLRSCTRCNGTGTYPPPEEGPTFPGIDLDWLHAAKDGPRLFDGWLHAAKADAAWLNTHVAAAMAFRSAWLISGAVLAINWPGAQAAIRGDLRVAAHMVILPEYLAALGARAVWLANPVRLKCRKAIEQAAEEAGVVLPTHWARCFDPEEAAEVQEP